MTPHVQPAHAAKAGGQDAVEAAWPINEIVMRSLVLNGVSDAEIAAAYGTSRESVTRLRNLYDTTRSGSD